MAKERKVYEDEDFIVTRENGIGRVYGKRDEDNPSDLDLLEFFSVRRGQEVNDDTARREFYRRFMGEA